MAHPPLLSGTRIGRRAGTVAAATFALCVAAFGVGLPSSATATTPAKHPCSRHPELTCVFGIPYVDDGLPVHTLDAYYPTELSGRASVVLIHGGRWTHGSSRSFEDEAAYFAENGFAVFVINFTQWLHEQPSWPQVRQDIEAATGWVMTHADEYHGDNARVGVLGGSSGGHLAALLDTAGPENGVRPLAAVSWSAAMDLTIAFEKGNHQARNGISQLLGCRPDDCPQTFADASPVSHVSSDDGSMLFFHSSDEAVPVSVAHEMNKALAAAGVPHTLVVFKNSIKHSREYECDQARVAGRTATVIDDSMRWLGTQLSQPTSPDGSFCAAGRP